MNKNAGPPTSEWILAVTSRHFGVPTVTLLDTSNHHGAVVYPRHMAMYLAHTVGFHSFENIGLSFHMNKETIRYGYLRVEKEINSEHTKKHIRAIVSRL